MPLRDHFRPPTGRYASWEGFHGQWPAMMVQHLNRTLPAGFSAEPRVRLGTFFEIDVGTVERDEAGPPGAVSDNGGGTATATWAPPQPTLTVETDLSEQYEYEVRVYDLEFGRRLVAAIEIVSPANKDRPEHRRAFVAKTAALLQQGVCVSVVDLVTVRHFNLYADLLDLIERSDPSLGTDPPPVYAATCRGRKAGRRPVLDTWFHALAVGRPLPTLPVWLSDDAGVLLDLEASYEETCRALRIP